MLRFYQGRFTPLHHTAHKAVDMLVDAIGHLPHGYAFLGGLPRKGRNSTKSTRRNWAALLLHTFYPPGFLTVLLQTCLLPNGTVNASCTPLYTWMLRHVYNGNVKALYADWLALQDMERRKDAREA